MKNSKNNFMKNLLYFFIILVFLSILIISFFAFKKLVLPYDLILKDGRKVSFVAGKIREKLIKRNDLEPVTFSSKDGIKLSGFFIKRKNPIGNVILCHGYQSCKEFLHCVIDMLPEYNILMFDFRAHGKSCGRFRTIGCHEYKDLFAAVDFLKEKTKPNKIFTKKLPLYIIGISMGGSVSIDAVAKKSDLCDALIVDSAFSNLKEVVYNAFKIKSGLPSYPFAPIIIRMVNFVTNSNISKFCPLNCIKKIDKPIFFIHSCIDNVVNPDDTLKMYANSINKKTRLWIGPPCKHGHLRRKYSEKYAKKINKFLRDCRS
ncbi:alpha/beta fold hydrolase [Candidatus Dependentiae bacterium]|nr:alpha/beta fold hydrolase [Candidatus Dependentiae bacterium]